MSIELRMPSGAIATLMPNDKRENGLYCPEIVKHGGCTTENQFTLLRSSWNCKNWKTKLLHGNKMFNRVSLFPTNLTLRWVAVSGVTMVLNWLVPDFAAYISSDNRHKLKMADHHGVYPSNSRPSSFHQRSSHSRSASWSYTSGNGQITLTPLNPIRSVIREFVPSFGHRSPTSRSSTSSPLSPLSPSTYVNITEVLTDGNNLNQTEVNRVPSYTAVNSNSGNSSEVDLENGEAHTGTSNNTNGNGRSGGDRVEFQGTINWIEKSLPFVLLLMSRIMWDHRLGM